MIRKFKESDLPRIMQIWLSANKEAHGFIKESYWDENFEAVKAALPCGSRMLENYVHENAEAEPDGFIGLNGEHIEGLFVDRAARNMGIGKELLDFVKINHTRLTLNVYIKNSGAVKFYRRELFSIDSRGIDEETGEEDYLMSWNKK